MKRLMHLLGATLLLLLFNTHTASALEARISGFPPGVGTSISNDEFVVQAGMTLVHMSEILSKDSLARVQITAWADGIKFSNRHDPLNAATALSRYDATVKFLAELGIPAEKILPPITRETDSTGPQFRRVDIKLVWPSRPGLTESDVMRMIPKPRVDTMVQIGHTETNNFFSLAELAGGLTITPFGKPTFALRGRVGNPTVSFDAELGLSIATDSWQIGNSPYDVRYRLIAGHASYAPFDSTHLEFVFGWERNEAVVNDFGRFVKKREGPVVGLGWYYQDWINIEASGVYPKKHSTSNSVSTGTITSSASASISPKPGGKMLRITFLLSCVCIAFGLACLGCTEKLDAPLAPQIQHDTTFVFVPGDTVFDTTIANTDTIVDTIIIPPDTITVIDHDTTFVYDTLFAYDTTITVDTVVVHDTTTVYDTTVVVDTVLQNVYVTDTVFVTNLLYKTCKPWLISYNDTSVTVNLGNPHAGTYTLAAFRKRLTENLPDKFELKWDFGNGRVEYTSVYGDTELVESFWNVDLPRHARVTITLTMPQFAGKITSETCWEYFKGNWWWLSLPVQ